MRRRKAWLVSCAGFDGAETVYAPNAGKAKYRHYLSVSDCYGIGLKDMKAKRAKVLDVYLPEEHRLVKELTNAQRNIVFHAYGGCREQHGYRSHYHCDPGNLDLLKLAMEFGLFEGPYGEIEYYEGTGIWCGCFFYLTKLGKEVALSMVPTYPTL